MPTQSDAPRGETTAVYTRWARFMTTPPAVAPGSAPAITPATVPMRADRREPAYYQTPMGGVGVNFRLGMLQAQLEPAVRLPFERSEAIRKWNQAMPPKNYREYVDVPYARVMTPAVTGPQWWR